VDIGVERSSATIGNQNSRRVTANGSASELLVLYVIHVYRRGHRCREVNAIIEPALKAGYCEWITLPSGSIRDSRIASWTLVWRGERDHREPALKAGYCERITLRAARAIRDSRIATWSSVWRGERDSREPELKAGRRERITLRAARAIRD
jgi:hypothetical protein